MEIFETIREHGHEQVVFWSDPAAGYRGIIAIHDTTLGPSLGGTRFWNYASEQEALVDVLRLSRGMTFTAAVAGFVATKERVRVRREREAVPVWMLLAS